MERLKKELESLEKPPVFQTGDNVEKILKEKAIVKAVKKSIALRALEETKKKKENIEQLKKVIEEGGNFALIFSAMDPYELAAILVENKTPSKIKAGQTAPQDIILEPGQTDLPAGPIISELAKLKIKTAIEEGKIVIKERCVLVRKGEKVSDEVASVLAQLEIMPLQVGLEPLAAYDSKEKKAYFEIKIDKAGIIKELQEAASLALAIALHLDYTTNETIKLILTKANAHANALLNLVNKNI